MYQQEIDRFYARFAYGIGCPIGNIEGQPGHLFQCNIIGPSANLSEAFAQGNRFYAGKLDNETMLIVSAAEYDRAWNLVVDQILRGHYLPHGEVGTTDDILRGTVYIPAYDVVGNVDYWLGQ